MKGRFYAVTGAASGIGQAVVIRLAELGAAGISISDVNTAGLDATRNLCESHLPDLVTSPESRVHKTEQLAGVRFDTRIIAQKVDVSQYDQVEKWIQYTVDEFGRLDGAANAAGIAHGSGDSTCATMVL